MSIAHPVAYKPELSSAKKQQRPFQLIGELINHSFARAARAWKMSLMRCSAAFA